MSQQPDTGDDDTLATSPQPLDEISVGPATDVPDGVYEAELTSISTFTYASPDGPRELLEWKFSIPTDDGPPVEVSGVSSRSSSLKGKAATWISALLGGTVKPGQAWKVAELVGRQALLTIEHNNETGFPKVVAVTALPKASKRR